MPDVLVGRHHAGGGHGLVEARPAPRPRGHAHAQLVPGLAGGGVVRHGVLITLPGAHTRAPRPPRPLSAWPRAPVSSMVTSPVLRGAELTSGDTRGRCLVTSEPGLVPTLDNETGTRGRESGFDTLPVLERGTEVTLPHTLDTVLDIRKLTYLRLCNKRMVRNVSTQICGDCDLCDAKPYWKF